MTDKFTEEIKKIISNPRLDDYEQSGYFVGEQKTNAILKVIQDARQEGATEERKRIYGMYHEEKK